MIELRENSLQISFPEVHADARMSVEFQRTLRIPDDGETYPLPAGLGAFPCQHVDDYAQTVPTNWLERGGIMLPMYQSEAMWINFSGDYISDRETCYPFAMKIAAGKINAVTGKKHKNKLKKAPQDYVVVPEQPWLDGFCVEQGVIRQFVAMPLGDGYSAEEQITGEAEHGGLQIIVYPMKREVFEQRFPKIQRQEFRGEPMLLHSPMEDVYVCDAAPDMGLAPGGRMKQEIYDDPFDFSDWDQVNASRCFVHLANSLVWRQITGEEAPTVPPTSEEYGNSDLPWFDYYSEATAVEGSKILNELKSVATIGKQAGKNPLPENASVTVDDVQLIRRGLSEDEVRDSQF
ncbi:MAG: hypothetical protein QGF67_19630 [Lentisphaeria bacterium]|jgi:hypothetical protein|nr:hypothetical protein [Lentisphaeria bacterium]MDP7743661.1 hypothetical protein [Lentisphaeria bacterium]